MEDDDDLSVISVHVHCNGFEMNKHFSGAVGTVEEMCVVAHRCLIPSCVGGGFVVRVHLQGRFSFDPSVSWVFFVGYVRSATYILYLDPFFLGGEDLHGQVHVECNTGE